MKPITPAFTMVNSEAPIKMGPGWYRLANVPIYIWIIATVTVTGSLINPDGSVTDLNGTVMSLSNFPICDGTMGEYYNIGSENGDLYFSPNVTVTEVTVTYAYHTPVCEEWVLSAV